MAACVNLVPYLCDYQSVKEVRDAWDKGRDFLIHDMFNPWDGKPMNKGDAEDGVVYKVYFKNKVKTCLLRGDD